jgi:hypothetical protein
MSFSSSYLSGGLVAVASFTVGYVCCYSRTQHRLGEFNVYRKVGTPDRFALLGTNGMRPYGERKRGYLCPIVNGQLWKFGTEEMHVDQVGALIDEYTDKEANKYKWESRSM